MDNDESVDQVDVGPLELFHRERVVEIWLSVYDDLELPLHQIGGDTLSFGHFRALEFLKLGQTSPGAQNTITIVDRSLRRQLTFEAVLLLPGEIPCRGCQQSIVTHP